MAKPYDATTKALIEIDPLAFVRFLGVGAEQADVIDADVSTVTADSDRVIRVREPEPFLVHLEFQASYDPRIGERLLRYNVLLHYRHELPVHSVVILLRPQADGRAIDESVNAAIPGRDAHLQFRYHTVRLWRLPPALFLSGPPTLAPLALLADVAPADHPAIARQMWNRIEADEERAGDLATAAYVLAGLRLTAERIESLLRRDPQMKESLTYQLLVAEGKAEGRVEGKAEGRVEGRTEGRMEEAQRLVLRIGERRLGPVSESIRTKIQSLTDVDVLEALADRIATAESWADVLPGA